MLSYALTVCSDWKLHLKIMYEMLPHFHTLDHARCAHLYLQQVSILEETMSPEEFEGFTFVVTSRSGEWKRCGHVPMRDMKI